MRISESIWPYFLAVVNNCLFFNSDWLKMLPVSKWGFLVCKGVSWGCFGVFLLVANPTIESGHLFQWTLIDLGQKRDPSLIYSLLPWYPRLSLLGLHTVHWTLNTTHCTLHPLQYTLHTSKYTLHTGHCTLHTAHCTQPLHNSPGHLPGDTVSKSRRTYFYKHWHRLEHRKHKISPSFSNMKDRIQVKYPNISQTLACLSSKTPRPLDEFSILIN